MDHAAEFMTRPAHAHTRTREALRAAQVEARRTAAAAGTAAQVARRAGDAADKQHQAVDLHAGLTDRVVAWAAGVFRSGRDAQPGDLPPDLAAAREAQAVAQRRWSDAKAVHAALAAEAQAAADQATAARAALANAVDDVLRESALALVDTARQATAEAARLRVLLAALSSTRTGSSAPLPWPVQQLAHDPVNPHLIDLAPPGAIPSAAAAWTAYRLALVEDATATAPT